MLLVLIAISFFVFRSLFFNVGTHLLDWNDYPLYVWIFIQNITHFKKFDLVNIFNGNIFYPNSGTLLFSDLLLPQSLMALPLTFFTKNPILIFNIIFFLTLILNSLAITFFWKNFTKNKYETFLASLLTLFSAFMFVNRVHFQMLSIWPFFFGLAYLFKEKNYKNIGLLSFWTIIQFYSGIYLGTFMLFIIGLHYLWEIILNFKNKIFVFKTLKSLSFFLGFFILAVGPLFLAYLNVRVQYHAHRDYGEYVSFSGDLVDYIFPTHLNSFLGNNRIVQKWSNFGHRAGIFPGFITLFLATFGFFKIIPLKINKDKIQKNLAISLNQTSAFFLGIGAIGFVFSLGPRLNANGYYLGIPLPYHLVMKINPLFEAIRVPYRWSLLLFIALVYFAILGMQKIKTKQNIWIIILSFLFIAELIPLNLKTEIKQYYPKSYLILENKCQNKVLLEYPMTQFKKDANVITNLTYRTQTMLASTHHQCYLINGYTGYTPQEYINYETQLFSNLENKQKDSFFKLLEEKKINFLKLNKKEIFSDKAQTIETWLISNSKFTTLYNDQNYLIMKLK